MNEGTVFFNGAATETAPGRRLNDTYEVLDLIGEGGLSEVYRGVNIHNGQFVAIKFLRFNLLNDAATKELFRRESEFLLRLHHEAIVRYFGYSFDPALRREYIVMEFVEGESLKARLAKAPLTVDEILTLKSRLADALDAAHRAGVVHRDISPDNIVLPRGEIAAAKIIDFGIAKDAALSAGTVIGDGFAGKYAYVSPEQVRGEAVTAKSDIYSLGLVLAEAHLGAPLDMGRSLAELSAKRAAPPDLTGVDARLRPLLDQMLQPSPADRPRDMQAVSAWRPLAGGAEASLAARASGARRFGAWTGGLAAAVLLVSLGATAFVYRDDLLTPGGDAHGAAAPETPPASPIADAATPDAATPTATPSEAVAPATPAPLPTPAASVPPTPADAGPGDAAPPRVSKDVAELDIAFVGKPFRQTLPPFESAGKLTISAATPPPPGLSVTDDGHGTATLEGVPQQAGSTTFEIVASDRAGRSARMEVVAIVEPPPPAAAPETPPPIAATPAATPARQPQAAGRAITPTAVTESAVARFVADYDGGDCWLARARDHDEARFEALAADPAAFDRFSADWVKTLGASAQFARSTISAAQCPALALLRASPAAAAAPTLTMQSSTIGESAPLAGAVSGLNGRALVVLVVRDNGRVSSLKFAPEGSNGAKFSQTVGKLDPDDVGKPLLILALASDRPLPALGDAGAQQPRAMSSLGKVNDVVAKLMAQLSAAGGTVEARVVTLARP